MKRAKVRAGMRYGASLMTRPCKTALTFALATCLLAQSAAQTRDQAAAPGATGTVTGTIEAVTDGRRLPLRRAGVTLVNEDPHYIWKTTTDTDGRFLFSNVPAGRFSLEVRKPGFVPAAQDDVFGPFEVRPAETTVRNLRVQRGGALQGRFLDTAGVPIARLTVTADWVDGPTAGDNSFHATTDDIGRFRVHTLPPGRYRLHATPPPPASGERLFHPNTAEVAKAAVIALQAGETMDGLDFTVPAGALSETAAAALAQERAGTEEPVSPSRSARIAGRVVRSDSGQPVPGATVRLEAQAGDFRTTVRVDSFGQFELNRLPAGMHVLSAYADGFVSASGSLINRTGGTRIVLKDGERVTSTEILLAPASAIEGYVLDEFGDPAPGVIVHVTERRRFMGTTQFVSGSGRPASDPTDDRGWFRAAALFPGDYNVRAVPEPFARSTATGFTLTFFPGSSSADAATAVRLSPGVDAHDVRFSLVPAKTVTLSGSAVDASGREVAEAGLVLAPIFDTDIRTDVLTKARTGADGTFEFTAVPEGSYVVHSSAKGMFGATRISVADNAATGKSSVTLRLLAGGSIRGRIVLEGASPREGPVTPGVAFVPTDFTMAPLGGPLPGGGIMGRNGTFQITNVAWPGVLRATPRQGWALARVVINGRDVTDTPLNPAGSDIDGVEVVLTDRTGTLNGVVESSGQPAPGAWVVIFGAEASSLAYLTRTQYLVQADPKGVFTVQGLLPGRYLAVAVPKEIRLTDVADAELRPFATVITVAEGPNTLKLTLTRR